MLAKTIEIKDKRVFLIDQTLIPYEEKIVEIKSMDEMYFAIKNMVVRGAPAIGVAAAAGMALFIRDIEDKKFTHEALRKAGTYLKQARPTAVNLFWAVDKVLDYSSAKKIEELKESIWYFVYDMAEEDIAINKAIGRNGADLIPVGKKVNVQTHCNAGSLATVYWGTALGVIRELHNRNQLNMVYADETRPRLQGGKITAWELLQDRIPVTVLSDNMAAYMMGKGHIDMIVVGADRIATNGDVANKIGTYGLAIMAKYHSIPFYVAAPVSTIDFSISSGKEIAIEERNAEEVTHINGKRVLPEGVSIVNPSFDVTPAELITGIITEKKVVSGNYRVEIKNLKLA
ncbi:MAG: S-methyl-5-thioribose-1-phosphate isomerase [Candidatus Margulisbacteria bacterium GWF2_35_9]|nr:MAG: S-methyl-5-thioribose-1-phosphate isomerase [Candidatus Margulisbacteria bacterium GWF2_35_9]